jgi:hypothetical protein
MLKVRSLSLLVCTALALLAFGAVAHASATFEKGPSLYAPRPASAHNESAAGGDDCITQNVDPSNVTAGPFNISCPTPPTQWLRRFALAADHGLSGNVNVASVEIGVQQSTAGQPATINLYSLGTGDAFTYANMSLVGTVDLSVGAQSQTLLSTDVCGTVNADTDDLVVEIVGALSGFNFVPGANAAGETAPGYIASNGCGLGDPSTYDDVGFPGIHLIMTVCFGGPCGTEAPALGPLGALLMIVALGGGSAFVARRRQTV